MARFCASADCGTLLSRYNPSGRCHAHTESAVAHGQDPHDAESWLAFLADIDPWEAPRMVQPPWAGLANCASGGQYLDDAFAEETSDGEPTEQVLAFKSMCLDCPVRRNCLEWAMEHESDAEYREGIFGGLTPRERAEITDVDAGIRELDEQHAMRLVLKRQPVFPFKPFMDTRRNIHA